MTDFLWPADLCPRSSSVDILDNSGRFSSPVNNRARTIGRPGTRARLRMSFPALSLEKRALYTAILSALGGMGRVWCHDHSHEERSGVTAFADLVTNPTFADNMSGYTVGSVFSNSLSDRVLRLTRVSNSGTANSGVRLTDAVSVTANRPYVGRMLVTPVRGPYTGFGIRFGSTAFGSDYAVLSGQEAGMLELAFVPYASTAHFGLTQLSTTAITGDSFEIPFISVQPCALIDNAPNVLPWSSDINNAAWGNGGGIATSTTSVTLPDGSTSTVNTLKENSDAATSHFIGDNITVASTVGWWCLIVGLKAVNRTWAQIRIQDVTSTDSCRANINLTTGAIGTVGGAAGSWQNIRGGVMPLGNDNHILYVIARNTNANTIIGARVLAGEADEDTTFTGLNQDSIIVWRPTLAQSGVPIRLSSTAGTAVETGTAQYLGGGLHTKGWPVSTNEIRKKGDVIGLNGQLIKLTAPINSDALGRAWVEHGGHLVAAPDDNAPLILTQPMGKFMLENPENGWTNMPGIFSDAEIALVEAP